VALGRPVANTQAYVLDGRMQPVPVGVEGELYLGGAALARGYLNRPALTAERFVPDPFGREVGDRLYRTGDVVRYGADGEVEFVGRVDNQVKVRGYRVELGEIEAALLAQPGVGAAAVVLREGARDPQLVAYVVPEAGGTLSAGELRASLSVSLPEHMIPTAFVELEELPLTPNGKVDRRALPEPGPGDARAGGYVAPRTAVEENLCDIWSEVLGVGRVGVEDNFFELGGHSLLATRVTSRVRERFGVEFQLRNLFEAPTVALLGALVEKAIIGQAASDEIADALEKLDQLSDAEFKALLLGEDRLTADLDASLDAS
jgi:acyl carrier protein